MVRKNLIFILSLALLFAFNARAESLIDEIVGRISQTSYTNYLDNLLYTHLGDDRGYGSEHDLARENIYSSFESYGLSTSLHPFTYSSNIYYNVVGVHPGTVRPEDIYIIGAHYDSFHNPGADDNASGVAAVMEAARVMSDYEFEATLIFMGFDREEQGLVGSRAYAGEHTNDNILGMISMDMIAYNGSGSNKANIYGQDSSAAIKNSLADAISLYGNGLTSEILGRKDASDHAPFEQEGFQACLMIEYDLSINPHYHRLTDSVDTANYIDYAFATNMVRSSTGFFATSAVAIPEPGTLLLLGLGVVLLRRAKA